MREIKTMLGILFLFIVSFNFKKVIGIQSFLNEVIKWLICTF